jgi:hypothetical protein
MVSETSHQTVVPFRSPMYLTDGRIALRGNSHLSGVAGPGTSSNPGFQGFSGFRGLNLQRSYQNGRSLPLVLMV